MMGTTPEQGSEKSLDAGGRRWFELRAGVAGFVEICRRLHAASGRAVRQGHAGLPEMRDGKTHWRRPGAVRWLCPQLVAAGAGFVGGCCGTSPEFICAICEIYKNKIP